MHRLTTARDNAAPLSGAPRIAVITAVAGGKDRLTDPDVDLEGTELIAFVDERQPNLRCWGQRPLPEWSTDPQFAARRNAKVPKVLPWLLAPGYDFYIWMDGNYTLKVSPREICDRLLRDQCADLALFRHPSRNCVFQEANVIKRLGLDRPELVDAQMSSYREIGHPEGCGLYASPLLVYRHTPNAVSLSLAWWDHICRYSSRDQLSLPVALRSSGCGTAVIDAPSHLDNPFFRRTGFHLTRHVPVFGSIKPPDRGSPA